KLVLAFDIGTTYSSASYCILEPHRVPECFPEFYRFIFTCLRFPAQGVARADTKVPSILFYDKSGTVRAAGAKVLSSDIIQTAQTEGWTKAEWWKIYLCPRHLTYSLDDLPPLPPRKSALDVLTDFITYLFDCCKTYVQECHPGLAWSSIEHSIEYILTYPSGWGEQQHLYCRALERAGLVPSIPEEQSRVHMLTEGEASLHSCVSHLLNGETAHPVAPQGVVIIDAGGGIIDMSMFSITMARNRIYYEEIAPAECRLQGSVFVTRRAQVLMERKLEGWEHSSAEGIAHFTRKFDETTKLVIESDQEPAYVSLAGRRINSQRYCISSGQLTLSGGEATGLFNNSIDAIIDGFEHQQKSTAMPITTAFLAGGLSANDWLWSRLQLYFTARNVNVRRLDNHNNKVVANGAVLSHVDHYNSVVAPRAT
ncbi:hypothetical protein V8E55_007363, partial [Tylopilus felleus]